jgi:hypothetical protein
MRKEQRKRDRKRKKKQEEKKRRARQGQSLAYTGNKYRSDELIPTWMHTEIGIYETYVMTDYKLVDRTVAAALKTLIRQLRTRTLPPLEETDELCYDVGREEDFLIDNIRRRWAEHFATDWKPPTDRLIGILRTILGSLETMTSPGAQSQSYLKHVSAFLTKELGVSVKAFSSDRQPLPEPDEDELIAIGRQWYADGDQEARAEFLEWSADLMRGGEAGRVIDACQFLVAEISDPSSEVSEELIVLSMKARQSLTTPLEWLRGLVPKAFF